MSPTKLPGTTETTLSKDDMRHIRNAWIWAALIIGIGMVLGGFSGELSKRGDSMIAIIP
jgi:hypothetical protein